MDQSRFDEMIKKLITRCRSGGVSRDNAVTVASKFLEISYVTSDIEREVDECRSAIMKNLRRHESMAMMVGRLRANCDGLVNFEAELKAFEDIAGPQIAGIEKACKAFSEEVRGTDENERKEAERVQRVREIIRGAINARDDVIAEINSVGRRVADIVAEIENTTALIDFKNKENTALREQMEREHRELLRRRQELASTLTELSTSKN